MNIVKKEKMSTTPKRKKEIKEIVRTLQDKSLSDIAKENEIQVYTLDLNDVSWDNISWAIFKSDDGKYKIYINSSDTPNRQRFTLAHELGHYYLHKNTLEELNGMIDKQSPYLFRSTDIYDQLTTDKRIMEEEANLFAAELLMPEEKVRKIWKHNDDVKELAKFFWVSLSAMSFRLENLDLI